MENKGYTTKDKAFWHIAIALALTSFFIFATMYAAQPILPLFTEEFNISVTFSSLSMSLTTVGLIVGLIVIGFLSDQHGRTIFIKLSIISTVILLFLIPLAPSFTWVVLFRLLQGFTMAGVAGAAIAYITEEIDSKYVAFATALYIAANSAGGMAGRFLIGTLAEEKSWEFAFTILGVFGLVIFVYAIIALPASKRFAPTEGSFREDLIGFFVHLKNPSMLVMFGLGVVLQVSFTGMWTYLPFHLINPPYELTLAQIAFFYLAYSFGIIGAPIAGWLTAKYTLRAVRVTGIFILSIGMIVVFFPSIWAISIGLAIICFGFFTTHSIAATTVAQLATHHKGSASSLYLVSYYIGVSAGTTFLSPVWETFAWKGIIVITASLPIIYYGTMTLVQNKKANIS